MTDQIYLVTGATGETGRYTVKNLLAKGHAVRVLIRTDDERAAALRWAGVDVMIGDLFEHDDVIRATAGVTAAYFCYPVRPGLIQTTAYFAEAAKRAGLKAIVNMSQISAREDSESHAARDHWISERLFDWSGVPTVHLRPTFFAQWLLYPFIRGLIAERGIIDLPYGDGRHAPIAAEDQARLIAAILTNPTDHVGKTHTLHGPTELNHTDIAAAMSDVLGREIRYQPTTIAQYGERLEGLGLPGFLIQHFCAIALDYQNGIFAGEDQIIKAVTGTAPMTIREFVASHRAALEPVRAAA